MYRHILRTINIDDMNNLDVKQAHVIEKLKLYNAGSTPIGTYTASDYNPNGAYENRWWPVAIALIAAGLLIANVALFVVRKRRQQAYP